MHYMNGREAKNGDMMMIVPKYDYEKPVVGILYNAKPGNDTCNGSVAHVTSNDPCPNLAQCLHIDDVKIWLDKIPLPEKPKKPEPVVKQ